MLETVTITEYTITITTRSRRDYRRKVKMLNAEQIKHTTSEERKIELCSICHTEIVYGYTSFGTMASCDNCKLDNLDSFPQCTRCGKNPKEPLNSNGYCWSCILDTNPDAPEDSYIGVFRKTLLDE